MNVPDELYRAVINEISMFHFDPLTLKGSQSGVMCSVQAN